jgi:hypothetical protein
MNGNERILNTSRGYGLKRKDVMRGIQNGAFVWDENNPGCVRDATLAEKYEAMMAEAAQRERNAEPLARAELAGIFYRPVAGQEKQNKESHDLAKYAREFAVSASAA